MGGNELPGYFGGLAQRVERTPSGCRVAASFKFSSVNSVSARLHADTVADHCTGVLRMAARERFFFLSFVKPLLPSCFTPRVRRADLATELVNSGIDRRPGGPAVVA